MSMVERVREAMKTEARLIHIGFSDWHFNQLARAAIAAMRPPAVPDEVREVVKELRFIAVDTERLSGPQLLTRAADLLERLARPSAVPDEVREVVRWLRGELAGDIPSEPMYRRAADLLERLVLGSGPPSGEGESTGE